MADETKTDETKTEEVRELMRLQQINRNNALDNVTGWVQQYLEGLLAPDEAMTHIIDTLALFNILPKK